MKTTKFFTQLVSPPQIIFISLLLMLAAVCLQAEISIENEEIGITYETISKGVGRNPNYGDTLVVHLKIVGESGRVYLDTKNQDPFSFILGLDNRFTDWEELFLTLHQGDEISFIGRFEHNFVETVEPLIYHLTLLEVISPLVIHPYDIEGKTKITNPSGLQYILIEEGDGTKANLGYTVTFHFIGFLPDGTIFASSAVQDEPMTLTLGIDPMIQGWVEGLALMREGDKIRFIVPPKLGFQDENRPENIPESSLLIFDIIMLKVE